MGKYIIFRDFETHMDEDEDGLFVSIPLDLILQKIPKTGKAAVYQDQAAVELEYESRLQGVEWRPWMALNLQQTKDGKRALSAYAKLLSELAGFHKKYGTKAMTRALRMCWQPRHANIPYVRTILKNDALGKGEEHQTSPAASSWKEVLSAIKHLDVCYNKKFTDPKIQPVIQKMGGWDSFRGQTTKVVTSRKRDFFDFYLTFSAAEPVDLHRAPGILQDLAAKIIKPVEKKKIIPIKSFKRKPRGRDTKVAIRDVIQAGDTRGMAVFQREYPTRYAEVQNELAKLQGNG